MARHVLLADDSTTIHRIVTDILTREGLEVTCVENGEEALRSILEASPDLVLADLTMPRMGGMELCELMRREPDFRHIPVIFLVSPFDDYNESAAQRVGASGHLVKPFDGYRLMSLVNRILPPEPAQVALEEDDGAEPEELEASAPELPDGGAEEGALDDEADLPEPMGLTVNLPPVGEDFPALELSDHDRTYEGETVELDPSAVSQATAEMLHELAGQPAADMPDMAETIERIVQLRFNALGGSRLVERILREEIRDEVRRILPGIVEAVVRERVRELELELEARSRIPDHG